LTTEEFKKEWRDKTVEVLIDEEARRRRQMKAQIDESIKSDRMKPNEAMRLLDDYERGLKEYTYLSF